ncbi:MAG: MBL fold metallo-hydrolase, partial [Candidatus Hydrothermota bacterium]
MKVRITPIGAAGTVTGSMYLFEYKGHKFLIEAGMFQGHLEPLNYEDFPFDPKEIEFIILSHPHLDHIGLLPKLVREGFSGEVIATPATRDIASIMLLDAAHLQEEDW